MKQDLKTDGGWNTDFRRSIWKGIFPMLAGLVMAAIALRGNNPAMSVVATMAFLSGAVELFLALREPLLTITPGMITCRTGFLGRPIEIPRPEVKSWKIERKILVMNRKMQKPVKVRLWSLRGQDQPRVPEALRALGYPESE